MLAQLYHCQNQAATLFKICKMHFRCHLWGICDLEHCYCIAALNMYFQRKMGWPQSPLTDRTPGSRCNTARDRLAVAKLIIAIRSN